MRKEKPEKRTEERETIKERRETIAKTLISQGQFVPQKLLRQIEEDKIKDLQNDIFNKGVIGDINTNEDHTREENTQQPQQPQHPQHPQSQLYASNNQFINPYQLQQFYQQQRYHPAQQQYQQQQVRGNIPIPPNINKYAPEYARLIGHKPKATASANIRLGGVY